MEAFGIETLLVSDRSLRDGLLLADARVAVRRDGATELRALAAAEREEAAPEAQAAAVTGLRLAPRGA